MIRKLKKITEIFSLKVTQKSLRNTNRKNKIKNETGNKFGKGIYYLLNRLEYNKV